MAVFHMSEDQAYRVMMTAHQRGACVVAAFTREIAESKATEGTNAGRQAGHPLDHPTTRARRSRGQPVGEACRLTPAMQTALSSRRCCRWPAAPSIVASSSITTALVCGRTARCAVAESAHRMNCGFSWRAAAAGASCHAHADRRLTPCRLATSQRTCWRHPRAAATSRGPMAHRARRQLSGLTSSACLGEAPLRLILLVWGEGRLGMRVPGDGLDGRARQLSNFSGYILPLDVCW